MLSKKTSSKSLLSKPGCEFKQRPEPIAAIARVNWQSFDVLYA